MPNRAINSGNGGRAIQSQTAHDIAPSPPPLSFISDAADGGSGARFQLIFPIGVIFFVIDFSPTSPSTSVYILAPPLYYGAPVTLVPPVVSVVGPFCISATSRIGA